MIFLFKSKIIVPYCRHIFYQHYLTFITYIENIVCRLIGCSLLLSKRLGFENMKFNIQNITAFERHFSSPLSSVKKYYYCRPRLRRKIFNSSRLRDSYYYYFPYSVEIRLRTYSKRVWRNGRRKLNELGKCKFRCKTGVLDELFLKALEKCISESTAGTLNYHNEIVCVYIHIHII